MLCGEKDRKRSITDFLLQCSTPLCPAPLPPFSQVPSTAFTPRSLLSAHFSPALHASVTSCLDNCHKLLLLLFVGYYITKVMCSKFITHYDPPPLCGLKSFKGFLYTIYEFPHTRLFSLSSVTPTTAACANCALAIPSFFQCFPWLWLLLPWAVTVLSARILFPPFFVELIYVNLLDLSFLLQGRLP